MVLIKCTFSCHQPVRTWCLCPALIMSPGWSLWSKVALFPCFSARRCSMQNHDAQSQHQPNDIKGLWLWEKIHGTAATSPAPLPGMSLWRTLCRPVTTSRCSPNPIQLWLIEAWRVVSGLSLKGEMKEKFQKVASVWIEPSMGRSYLGKKSLKAFDCTHKDQTMSTLDYCARIK